MPTVQKIERKTIEKIVNKPFDDMTSKANKLLKSLESDYDIYNIAVINMMSRPLTLFGKEVKAFSGSDKIKVSKERYYELKSKKFFKREAPEEDIEGKKLLGVEIIENELDLLKHNQQIELIHTIPSIQPKLNIKGEREPSKYQKAIFDYIKLLVNNDPRAIQKNVVVEAVAGSGKTFTLEQATKLIPKKYTSCFLAFNTHIVNEFRPRAPEGVKVMTLNSVGYQAVLHALRSKGKKINSKINKKNVSDILDTLFKSKYNNFSIEEIDNLKPAVIRLVSLYKATGLEINGSTLEYLMDRYNISTSDETQPSNLISLTKDVLNVNYNILTNTWQTIDFDDQIYVTVARNLLVERFDFVFIDETQDLNASQLELCIKLRKEGGSIIAVGDRNQSIYGFRGADTEAIPRIIERLNAKTFPLSITYRCPKSHVKIAQQFVPEIEYATTENSGYEAIEGSVESITLEKLIELAQSDDKVICRNNAPLVHPCFQLIRAGKKATILGRDIGDGLINLMTKIKGSNLEDFMFRLDRWMNKERDRLESKNQSIDKIMDQYEILQVLTEDCDNIKCIINKIDVIFSDKKEAIVFSTIHKAKGLEAKTKDNSIFIIKSHKGKTLMPSPYASKEWELLQEKNLQYVAYTRGKNKMYIIE